MDPFIVTRVVGSRIVMHIYQHDGRHDVLILTPTDYDELMKDGAAADEWRERMDPDYHREMMRGRTIDPR